MIFHCMDKTMFHTLYVTLVCPHLEYASEIWNPHLMRDQYTSSGESGEMCYHADLK